MKTKFMLNGPDVSVLKLNEDQLLDDLPARIYAVQHNPFTGYYLTTVKDELEIPSRIYGSTVARADKCIKAYNERSMSTGILLTGDKGTGKTLLMSVLANKAVNELGLPVVLVKEAFGGSDFITFIETMGECVLVFDEFGKMYKSDARHSNNDSDVPQTALLSLMDGVDKTKRMFILAENSQIDINEFMLNRPSRIYYHFKYKKLDEASVTGYCKDNAVDTNTVKDIVDLARRSKIFSFDMLQSIIEEHLRFDCTIDEAVADLNIDIREDRGALMKVEKIIDRKTDKERKVFGTAEVVQPSMHNYVYIKVANEEGNERTLSLPTAFDDGTSPELAAALKQAQEVLNENEGYDEIYVRDEDLAYEKDKQLVYETDDFTFVCKKLESQQSDYWRLF